LNPQPQLSLLLLEVEPVEHARTRTLHFDHHLGVVARGVAERRVLVQKRRFRRPHRGGSADVVARGVVRLTQADLHRDGTGRASSTTEDLAALAVRDLVRCRKDHQVTLVQGALMRTAPHEGGGALGRTRPTAIYPHITIAGGARGRLAIVGSLQGDDEGTVAPSFTRRVLVVPLLVAVLILAVAAVLRCVRVDFGVAVIAVLDVTLHVARGHVVVAVLVLGVVHVAVTVTVCVDLVGRGTVDGLARRRIRKLVDVAVAVVVHADRRTVLPREAFRVGRMRICIGVVAVVAGRVAVAVAVLKTTLPITVVVLDGILITGLRRAGVHVIVAVVTVVVVGDGSAGLVLVLVAGARITEAIRICIVAPRTGRKARVRVGVRIRVGVGVTISVRISVTVRICVGIRIAFRAAVRGAEAPFVVAVELTIQVIVGSVAAFACVIALNLTTCQEEQK
jgi:hypothetical protein